MKIARLGTIFRFARWTIRTLLSSDSYSLSNYLKPSLARFIIALCDEIRGTGESKAYVSGVRVSIRRQHVVLATSLCVYTDALIGHRAVID